MTERAHTLAAFAALATIAFAPVALAAPPSSQSVDVCIRASEAGQVERSRGHLRAARAEFARCLASACPGLIARDCNEFLGQVDTAMPSVVFRVLDAATNAPLVDASISIDGELVSKIDGRARPIDPGPHEVVATVSGYTPAKISVMGEEGVKSRVVEVRLAREGAPAYVAPVREPSAAPAMAPRSDDVGTGPTTGTIVGASALAGVGAIAIGTFAIVGLGADSDFDALQARCGTRCSQSEVDKLHTRYLTADVALAVGVGAIAGGALVFLLGPRRSAAPSTAQWLQPLRF